MKNSIKYLMALLICCSLTNCVIVDDDDGGGVFNCEKGEGGLVTESLDLDDITAIKLEIPVKVYLRQGPDQVVEVEGQENIIDELDLDVKGGRWDIEFDDCVKDYSQLSVFITIPDLRKIEINSSGEVFGETLFAIDDLDIEISGSGDVDLELECDDIKADISGSGKIKLIGIADDVDLKISGSGDYRGFSLEAITSEIDISGSGDVEVFVTEQLDIRISGSGDVYYKGYPELDIEISGSGDVFDGN